LAPLEKPLWGSFRELLDDVLGDAADAEERESAG